ncbi:MAG TPA: hemolysin family protein [Methylomirabilota bacterium]
MALAAFTVVTLLIFVNSLYVAAEFSAVSVRRSRIREMARGGHTLAARLEPVLASPAALDRYVAACQVGITLSSLVLGAYGQAVIAPALGPRLAGWFSLDPLIGESAAVTTVLLTLTMLQVLIGELVPKSLALQAPARVAMLTVLPMRWSLAAFRPLIHVLNGSGVLLLRLLGMPAAAHRHVHSPEELELLIAESRDGGYLEPEEQQRLRQALRLSHRTARQLMVPRRNIDAVDLRWTQARVLDAVLKSPHTRLPVYDGSLDRTIGLLHTRELAAEFARLAHVDRLRDLVSPLPAVPETATGDDLLRFFREHKVHQAVVTSEHGNVTGLVTLQDVVSALLGDVGDEFRAGAATGVETLPDGRLRLSGQLALLDLPGWLADRWTGPSDTVAGHIMAALGRLPAPGERVSVDGVAVEIEHVAQHVPASVLVSPVTGES